MISGDELGKLLWENASGFALVGVRYLLLLVTAVALVRLYRRAGHGRAWALLALLPVVVYPFAFYGILLGIFTVDEEEWIMTLFLAILPAMLVRLAFRRRPAESTAAPRPEGVHT